MPGRGQPKLARRRRIQQPRRQDAIVDQRGLLHLDALGVERLRTQATRTQRIVDDADVLGKQLRAELVLQEAGLARDRSAVDSADEMADQRTGHPRIEHDRHLAGRDLARIGARHGTLTGAAADRRRGQQIGAVRRRRVVIVALHAGAFTGDRGRRDALA